MCASAPASSPTYSLARLRTWTASEGQGYSADLMLGKAKVGVVEQDGVGGCTFVHYVSPEARAAAAAHVATLPDWEHKVGRGKIRGKATEESWIDDLVEDTLAARRFDRLMKAKIAFVRPDGRVVHLVGIKPTEKNIAAARMQKSVQYFRCLNVLPREEALALYKAGTLL